MRHTQQKEKQPPPHTSPHKPKHQPTPALNYTHDIITNRNHPPQKMAHTRPPPRARRRTNQLPRLRMHPRMGHHTPTNQPRTRPHHPIRTRRHRHHRQRTRHLPQMQPITRRQTHQLEHTHHDTPMPHNRKPRLVAPTCGTLEATTEVGGQYPPTSTKSTPEA